MVTKVGHPHVVPEAVCQELKVELTRLVDQLMAAKDNKTIKSLLAEIVLVEAALKKCPDESDGPVPSPQPGPIPDTQWHSLGPGTVSGRIAALAISPTDGNTVYAGSGAGGVFKTTNAGIAWSSNWEQEFSLAIGAMKVAPSNTSIVYVATGEWDYTSAGVFEWYPGVGVYRSSDAGNTWVLQAPIASDQTSAIAVDPINPDRVFVAGNKALHRSTSGGANWDILPGNINGVLDGIISDVVLDPNNPNRIYAGVHDSNLRSGGVWRSTDGGETWIQLQNGIPFGNGTPGPRISLGSKGAHGTSFVAVKMGDRVFTSVDGGDHFTLQSQFGQFDAAAGRGTNIIAVDPLDEMTIFAGDIYLFMSTNGGQVWSLIGHFITGTTYQTAIHEDLHDIVFDPNDNKHIYVACDNGVYESKDHGQTWLTRVDVFSQTVSGLMATQCWIIGVSQGPALAYGITTHDNFAYASRNGSPFDYVAYGSGGRSEGGWIAYDPKDANIMYLNTWQSGAMVKTTNGQQPWQQQNWTALPINSRAQNSVTLAIAWTNTSQLLAILLSNGTVSRSTNGGTSWTGVLAPGTQITAVRFAPSDDNHAYAASVDGRIWHSNDGGANWTELSRAGLPAKRIHDIQVDWSNPLQIYLAFADHGAIGAMGYRTLWRGAVGMGNQATWTDIGGKPGASLPDAGLSGLVIDPDLANTLYVSSIRGVHRTSDGGNMWAPMNEGLPNCFVSSLTIRKVDRALYLSTMGRGAFRRVV